MCFGHLKEPSRRDGSFEYPQHMFWLRNKKNNFLLRTLIWGPDAPPLYHQVRKWEKSLQQVFGETNVDKLKSEAKEELNKYFASLPKPSKLETLFIALILLNIFYVLHSSQFLACSPATFQF